MVKQLRELKLSHFHHHWSDHWMMHYTCVDIDGCDCDCFYCDNKKLAVAKVTLHPDEYRELFGEIEPEVNPWDKRT